MRVVIQRVCSARVKINGVEKSSISKGMLILLGIENIDELEDAEWLTRKISQVRIFNDLNGVMNLDIKEISGEILLVSQFTLHAKTKKGNRPSYITAAAPEKAIPLYELFVKLLKEHTQLPVKTGEFGAMMNIELVNEGPVTIIIDSRNRE